LFLRVFKIAYLFSLVSCTHYLKFLSVYLTTTQRRCESRKSWGQEVKVAIFRQTNANFQRRTQEIVKLKDSVLLVISLKMRI